MAIYYVAGIPFSDELYHHGIKGQRWGVRRFQNSDGSLTAEGKKRYGEAFGEKFRSLKSKAGEVTKNYISNKKADIQRKRMLKHPEKMTIEQLKEETERMNLQAAYAEAANRYSKTSWVKNLAKDIIADSSKKIVSNWITEKMNEAADDRAQDKERREEERVIRREKREEARTISKEQRDEERTIRREQREEGRKSKEKPMTQDRIREIMNNPDGSSDSDLQRAAQRSENLNKIRNANKNNNKPSNQSETNAPPSPERRSRADEYIRNRDSVRSNGNDWVDNFLERTGLNSRDIDDTSSERRKQKKKKKQKPPDDSGRDWADDFLDRIGLTDNYDI